MTWKPCPSPQTGDTIRWKEPLWAEPSKARGRPDEIGEQLVTAKVVERADVMKLEVVEVEILSFDTETEPPSRIKQGETIQRKRTSVERGECEKQH